MYAIAAAIVILGLLLRDGILRAVALLSNNVRVTHSVGPITIEKSTDGSEYKVQASEILSRLRRRG